MSNNRSLFLKYDDFVILRDLLIEVTTDDQGISDANAEERQLLWKLNTIIGNIERSRQNRGIF